MYTLENKPKGWHDDVIKWKHFLRSICAGNSPATGEFPAQRPVTRSFDVFFDLCLINVWVNNGEAGDLRRHRAHYDVTVMSSWGSSKDKGREITITVHPYRLKACFYRFGGCYFHLGSSWSLLWRWGHQTLVPVPIKGTRGIWLK